MAAAVTTARTGSVRPDRTRERATSVNQLLFGLAALLACGLVLVDGQMRSGDLMLLGIVLVFVLTVAAIVVRWNRVHPLLVLLIPVGDLVAVLLLQLGEPHEGLWMLWLAPATWLATVGGLTGVLAGTVGTSLMFWVAELLHAGPETRGHLVLGPIAIGSAAVVAYVAARRASAQRALLDEQAEYLDHAVERARRQEDAVSEVLDAVDFGVVRIGSDGTLSIENEAHARLYPSDSDSVPLFDGDGVTPTPAGLAPTERARRGESFEGVLTWQGPQGEGRRALQSTARRLLDANGLDVGGILVTRDVTAEQLAVQMRDELVASVSHELRTPLTSVLGHLDIVLEGDQLPESVRRSLEIAERNASRLLVIIGDILAATAEGAGHLDVRPVDEDVSRVVLQSVESLEPRAAARNIRIDAAGVEPARAEIDPLRIRQVVDNLVGNAVKYHTGDGLIEVDLTSDDRDVYLVVRDDGPGIAEEALPRLFDRYYRAESAGARAVGTGLGLSISRDLVKAHGGEITVQSEPGSGATFVVRLPRRTGAIA